MRRLALLLAVSLVLAAAPASADPARPDGRVAYEPPVEGAIVDRFRPPSVQWGPGNRGIDYRPGPGTPVWAAAGGEVVFAGQVGGELHVVVLHADGIRTSYSFLESMSVRRGDTVRQGQVVGTAGEQLHFGARVGDTYIDPESLFGGGPAQVYLVPDEDRRPASEAKERSGLATFLGGVGGAIARAGRAAAGRGDDVGRAVAGWAVDTGAEAVEAGRNAVGSAVAGKLDQLRGVAHYAHEFDPGTHLLRLTRTAQDWWDQRGDCTPASVRPPPLAERRMAVLIGGLGSTSSEGWFTELDTAALGYAADDVKKFSYNGGLVEESPYAKNDTTVDLRTSAERLRQVLERIHREHPGVPVDLIAHSQGGIVARTMLAYEYAAGDPRLPKVASLVTMGTPHEGADAATALAMTGHTSVGDVTQWALFESALVDWDLRGESVRQLSETSRFMAKLSTHPVPAGVNVTSIGARGDFTVAAGRTRLPGARNVTVSVPGKFSDHSQLPRSEAAFREVGLAVNGLPPTCQTLADMLVDTAVSSGISLAEDMAGAGAWYQGARADAAIEKAFEVPKMPPAHKRNDP